MVTARISNTFLSPYYLRSQVTLTPVQSPHCLLYLSSGHIVEGVITRYTYRVLLLTIFVEETTSFFQREGLLYNLSDSSSKCFAELTSKRNWQSNIYTYSECLHRNVLFMSFLIVRKVSVNNTKIDIKIKFINSSGVTPVRIQKKNN